MENRIDALSENYFKSLGYPKPGRPFNLIDDYRFYMAYRHLVPGSVLDVGVYYGDFLKLASKDGCEIHGTEVNDERVDAANRILGEQVVKLDFHNGHLTSFDDKSVDNVVCTEVIEHVPDHSFAVSELCRVARKRVIITVPFEERIQSSLCIYCHKYTPHNGHMHSYGMNSFAEILPKGWAVRKQEHFAKKLLKYCVDISRFPRKQGVLPFIRTMDLLCPGKGTWMLIVSEPLPE